MTRAARAALMQQFAKWRKRCGLTQAYVAALLGIHKQCIGRWENGAVPGRRYAAQMQRLMSELDARTRNEIAQRRDAAEQQRIGDEAKRNGCSICGSTVNDIGCTTCWRCKCGVTTHAIRNVDTSALWAEFARERRERCCVICYRRFVPAAHLADRQMTCGADECKRTWRNERERKANKWRDRH